MRHLPRTFVFLSLLLGVTACQPSTDEAESAQPGEGSEATALEQSAQRTAQAGAASSPNETTEEGSAVAAGRDQRTVPTAGVREPAARTICFIGSENPEGVEPAEVAAALREEAGDGVISLVLTAPDQGVRALADSVAAELQLNAIAQPQLRELGGDLSFEQRQVAARAGEAIGGADDEANDRAFARAVNLRGLFDTMIAAGTVAVVVAPPEFGTLLIATHQGAGMQAAFDQEPLAGGAVRCVTLAVEPPAAPPTEGTPAEGAPTEGTPAEGAPTEGAVDSRDGANTESSSGDGVEE